MRSKNYQNFRQKYEKNISKKLEIDKEEFHLDYHENKQPIFVAIFGGFLLLYGLYIIIEAHLIYGLLVFILGSFLIYTVSKKSKVVFRISKNGIWTKDIGFIYFRHIDHFEFYRHIGKYSSDWLKIYVKNFKLYDMDKPFLEQHISHIENCESLKNDLDKALTAANIRNKI